MPSKIKVASTKDMKCPRCGRITTHSLFSKKPRQYRCNICGNITGKKETVVEVQLEEGTTAEFVPENENV